MPQSNIAPPAPKPLADDDRAQLRRLRFVSTVEGTTLLLLLLIAVPLKHLGGWPFAVQVMGPIHGVAFVAYVWMLVQTVSGAGWPRKEVARLFLLAIVPVGGYVNAAFLSRRIASDRRP